VSKNKAEKLTETVLDHAMFLHREIGPGISESVYELILFDRLTGAGLTVDRQKPVNIIFQGKEYGDAFRYDLLVENLLLVELKSIELLGPVHVKQTLTYIRLMNLPIGLLLNFGSETLKQGIRKVYNNHYRD
jgi:GxxExxY protein